MVVLRRSFSYMGPGQQIQIKNLYVRHGAKNDPGYTEEEMKRVVTKAIRSVGVQRTIKAAHGLVHEGLDVTVMRAVASHSPGGEKRDHYTARLFRSDGMGEYLGGVHAFPTRRIGYATFVSAAASWKKGRKKWTRRTFADVQDIDPVN
ncbi:hypothetical protein NLJ89_g5300 [Agrocybe chaxingu]|uniref:Uncharacterized protein n=1 Tax=Agrocybe chaxingu TaxID=84603 RepID=A0A9W8K2K5_9AGAR|nr:hypothetical protein NLJ89_g5300 [Agrocybe chaxingu]